jgi:hypothetical protein
MMFMHADVMAMECYEIRVESHMGSGCATAFEEFTLRHHPDGETVLIGCVADQTALHGVLMKTRDLGLAARP